MLFLCNEEHIYSIADPRVELGSQAYGARMVTRPPVRVVYYMPSVGVEPTLFGI